MATKVDLHGLVKAALAKLEFPIEDCYRAKMPPNSSPLRRAHFTSFHTVQSDRNRFGWPNTVSVGLTVPDEVQRLVPSEGVQRLVSIELRDQLLLITPREHLGEEVVDVAPPVFLSLSEESQQRLPYIIAKMLTDLPDRELRQFGITYRPLPRKSLAAGAGDEAFILTC